MRANDIRSQYTWSCPGQRNHQSPGYRIQLFNTTASTAWGLGQGSGISAWPWYGKDASKGKVEDY